MKTLQNSDACRLPTNLTQLSNLLTPKYTRKQERPPGVPQKKQSDWLTRSLQLPGTIHDVLGVLLFKHYKISARHPC
jgi:hypothetical protein